MHNPKTIYRWAIRTMATVTPLAGVLLLGWGFRLHAALGARPYLVLMAFMLLVMVAAGAGVVAALASCHIAAHRAFSAGYTAGATTTAERLGHQRAEQRPELRVVGQDPTA